MKIEKTQIENITFLLNSNGEKAKILYNYVPRNNFNREVFAISVEIGPDKFIRKMGKLLLKYSNDKKIVHDISQFLSELEYEYSVDYIYY